MEANSKVRSTLLEKDFQERVLKKLREIPGTYWYKANDRTTAGIPDIIGCVAGIFFALELKTKSKVTPIQAYHLRKIEDAHGQSFVVTPDNWAKTYEFIRKIAVRAEDLSN
jgi:hypothetical protein